MYKDHQFSPGFLTLSGNGELDRLDQRQLADIRVALDASGTYRFEGEPIATPPGRGLRPLDLVRLLGTLLMARAVRHA